jgi:hypothetical protein
LAIIAFNPQRSPQLRRTPRMPYIVVKDGRYYSGAPLQPEINERLIWTPYRKEARRYSKRAWAQKAAERVSGVVEEVDK